MPRASTPTLLALDRWAAIMTMTPSWFAQATSDIIFPMESACDGITPQHPWQYRGAVSREEIAREIAQTEQDLADYLGWWPAPKWIAQDVKMYPRPHRPDTYGVGGINIREQGKSIQTTYGKIIEPGERAVTLLNTAAVPAFSDADLDGFSETVTVSVATTLTDECEIHCYFDGHNGEPEWEIRPARTATITGGVWTATYWAWQFIDPDIWESLPTATTPIPTADLDAAATYVAQVDVYREYNDPTAYASYFYWEPDPSIIVGGTCSCCGGTGCTHCSLTVQCGCLHIRDAMRGWVVPAPATYDSDSGAWASAAWSVCRDPDQIKLYYWAGDISQRSLAGRTCENLSDQWAHIIAHMTTARLERPLCDCGNQVTALAQRDQTDLAFTPASGGGFNVSFALLDNPFGTRYGEVMAWKYVSGLVNDRLRGATAV